MHKIISNNTIYPTKIVPGDPYASEIIHDFMMYKPKPEKDVLLIIGDGRTVLDDIGAWYRIAEGIVEYDTMCVNYSALICPHPFEHYAAGDAHMPDMQKVAKGLPEGVVRHAWNPSCPGFNIRWCRTGRGGWNGTSGNLAYKIGLAMDYTRIVLAGCPMDNSGNWYSKTIKDNDVKKVKDHRHHLWKWTEMSLRPIGRFCRSMSGNTADLFGVPTREWLLHLPEIEVPEKGEEEWKQKMH
uniref:Uncharacterized protein n=3 Tax=viral metagenome TaxID=1070528 RepID=A0A6M3KFN1_9ZZZZ